MTIFKRWQEKSGFTNQVKGRKRPQVPRFQDAPHYKGELDQALAYFSNTLGDSDDYMVRVTEVNGRSAACIYISTVSDHKITEEILHSIQIHTYPRREPKNIIQYLIERVLTSSNALYMTNLFEIREAVTAGWVVLLLDKAEPAIVVSAQLVEHRTPEQPYIESSSRGSQISFVENIEINIGLVRRNLTTDSLVVKKIKVGYRSRRNVAVLHIRDVANPTVVETVTQRIEAIHIDMIDDTSAVEQRISDHPWSLFPMTRTTQRIDNVVRELNQGKVVIMVDGDPTVLLAPATIQDFFQTQEDYEHTWWDGTFVRLLRFISFVLALYLPALYIAFVDFSPELLPKVLGLQIARSRENVPFPAVMEVIIMQLVIEILREATLRMPKQMGQTIGIVGGLVVGQAAVEAGIVSNILIIVVALTAISVFVTPNYEFSIVLRIGSWAMIGGATLTGFFGVVAISLWILYEVANLKSFGLAYLDPLAGEHIRDAFVDGLIRLPVTVMDNRASHLHPLDKTGSTDYEMPIHHPQLEKNRVDKRRKRQRRERERRPR